MGTAAVPNQNAGEVNNRGIDFEINWTDQIDKVAYSVGFNMGFVAIKLQNSKEMLLLSVVLIKFKRVNL